MSIGWSVSGLEDGQLPLLLLLPAFEVQSQNRLIHHAGEQEDLVTSSLGTRPSSSWRVTAILALRRRFFWSGVAAIEKVHQNPCLLSGVDTLIVLHDLVTCATAQLSCYRVRRPVVTKAVVYD